jgi:hypothetical protein
MTIWLAVDVFGLGGRWPAGWRRLVGLREGLWFWFEHGSCRFGMTPLRRAERAGGVLVSGRSSVQVAQLDQGAQGAQVAPLRPLVLLGGAGGSPARSDCRSALQSTVYGSIGIHAMALPLRRRSRGFQAPGGSSYGRRLSASPMRAALTSAPIS